MGNWSLDAKIVFSEWTSLFGTFIKTAQNLQWSLLLLFPSTPTFRLSPKISNRNDRLIWLYCKHENGICLLSNCFCLVFLCKCSFTRNSIWDSFLVLILILPILFFFKTSFTCCPCVELRAITNTVNHSNFITCLDILYSSLSIAPFDFYQNRWIATLHGCPNNSASQCNLKDRKSKRLLSKSTPIL